MPTHGLSQTPIYRSWNRMMRRCTTTNHLNRRYYLDRGITVCDEWKTFINFYGWAMENGYSEELSLDRIDVNGNYEPGNCRWADRYEQQRNRHVSRLATIDGVTKHIYDWCDEKKLSKNAIAIRYDKGTRGAELFLPVLDYSNRKGKKEHV